MIHYTRTDWRNEMYIIGAIIEKERLSVALFDKEYKLLLKNEGTASDFKKICENTMSEYGIKPADVEYIGVGTDGSAEADACGPGIKCYKDSLINARALGEAYTLNDAPSLFMLKIDDNIENSIVIDKKIYSGAYRSGGKAAHTVIDFGGYECSCGRRGCFEVYASNSGLKRIAAEAGVEGAEAVTHKKLFEMNTPNAELAKKLYVEYLASGIMNIINLFQTNELVLEGPFTEVGDALMEPMMEIILREQYSHSMPNKCNIRFSKKDEDTALIGAALLGR